jgi:hypothetical protein
MNLHVLPNVEFVAIIFYNFGLWMFRGGMETFALVNNYLDETWTLRHANVGLFEVHETIGNAMVLQQQVLLEKNGLIYHVIAFMKDEGNHLKTMVITLIVNL